MLKVVNSGYSQNLVFQAMIQHQTFNLSREEVHLWWVNLRNEIPHAKDYYKILSIDEINRAARYHYQQHRYSFIVRRGLLRIILSKYLSIHAKNLRFIYNISCRPSLDLPFQGKGLNFNISHSNGFAIYAITIDRKVGIDIEFINNSYCHEGIIDQMLSPKEMKIYFTLHPNIRLRAFYESWTSKEAYLKATGYGLSTPPHQVEVFFKANDPKIILSSQSIDPNRNQIWSLRKLGSLHGYAAALVVEGNDCEINNYFWRNAIFQSIS